MGRLIGDICHWRPDGDGPAIELEFATPLVGGKCLTTAEILYHMPDHPGLLQTFCWQYLDRAPEFPRLHKFLDHWSHHIDGALHSVRVAQAGGARAGGYRAATARTDLTSH